MAGDTAFVVIRQALQGVSVLSGISQAYNAIRGPLSIASTIFSGVTLAKNISEKTDAFGAGSVVSAAWQDDLMGEIRSHSGVGLAFRGNVGPNQNGKPSYNTTQLISQLQNEILAEVSICISLVCARNQVRNVLRSIENDIAEMNGVSTLIGLVDGTPFSFVLSYATQEIGNQHVTDLAHDYAMFSKAENDYNNTIAYSLAYIRSKAVSIAWLKEFENVSNGGDGITRKFTPAEKEELISNPKRPRVSGMQGHHEIPVSEDPELAGDPDNIRIVKGSVQKKNSEHYLLHFTPEGKRKKSNKNEKIRKK